MEVPLKEFQTIDEIVEWCKNCSVNNQECYDYLMDKIDPYYESYAHQTIKELKGDQ